MDLNHPFSKVLEVPRGRENTGHWKRLTNPQATDLLKRFKEGVFETPWRYPARSNANLSDEPSEHVPLDYFNKKYHKPKFCKKLLPSLRNRNQEFESLDDYHEKTCRVYLDTNELGEKEMSDLDEYKSPIERVEKRPEFQRIIKLRNRNDFKFNKEAAIRDYIDFFGPQDRSFSERVSTSDKLKRLYNLPPFNTRHKCDYELDQLQFTESKVSDSSEHLNLNLLFESVQKTDVVRHKPKGVKNDVTIKMDAIKIGNFFGRLKKKHRRKPRKLISEVESDVEKQNDLYKSVEKAPAFFQPPTLRLKKPYYMRDPKFQIENEATRTISKDENDVNFKFLILNKRLRLLVFCSPNGMLLLSECEQWQASGKFHTNSSHYYQLFVISVWFMGRMVPCVFALMHRRRQKDYEKLFRCIKKEANKEHKLSLKPLNILCDFQLNSINALQKYFPNAKVSGCILHYGKLIFTRLKKLRLQSFWFIDRSLQIFFWQMYWLCMVPKEYIIKQYILNDETPKPSLHGIQELSEYFKEKLLKGEFPKSYPSEFWNRYDDRTFIKIESNIMEDKRLKKYIGCKYPNIFKAIKIFQKEELHVSLLYKRYLAGEKILASIKYTDDWKRSNELDKLRELFINKIFTYEGYFESLLDLDFFRPPMKVSSDKYASSMDLSDSVNNNSADSDSD